ncbi:hypothetical protein Tco_0455384 [Tanacetum coccineum]
MKSKNEPGDEFEKVNWRYYDACKVHCLNLESADVYMLIERKWPLSAKVCKAMLDKKLQRGKPDKDCYKLLKMIEKQAGAKGLTSPEQTATGKGISNPFMAVMVCQKPYGIQLTNVSLMKISCCKDQIEMIQVYLFQKDAAKNKELQVTEQQIIVTGIKHRGGKIGSFGGAGVEKIVLIIELINNVAKAHGGFSV